jgi:glycosyltransferase involved in cell wall biosynthesis
LVPERVRRLVRGGRSHQLALATVGLVLSVALVAILVTRSWLTLLVTVTLVTAGAILARLAIAHHRRVAGRLARLQDELTQTRALLAASLFDNARSSATPPPRWTAAELAGVVVRGLLDRGDALDAYSTVVDHSMAGFDPVVLRRLRGALHDRGYLTKALEVARSIERAGGEPGDTRIRRRLEGEIEVLSGRFTPTVTAAGYDSDPGKVLHIVSRAVPQEETGYTLRTHYTAVALREMGVEVHVVSQEGGHDRGETNRDGVVYHRVPSPARSREPLDVWLDSHVRCVGELVRDVRPAVLHPASDYLNALTAEAIGKAYGIPVVYETRGFWEETWLANKTQEYGWDRDRLDTGYGLPDVYRWRRAVEDRTRLDADRVVALAGTMSDRIETGGVARDRVTVVPNAVDPQAFPVVTRSHRLASELGIGVETVVMGYVSSLTAYEGIDTLISAYACLKDAAPGPVALLIVGDGPARAELQRQARALGIEGVVFTGHVPHRSVLDYYSVIDIFVVPRRPAEVCHLVPPLKPYEALSTGRTVVLSDVRALVAIAEESRAAEVFRAGDVDSLTAVLAGLLKDPERRAELAAAGAAWVRSQRTWAANARAYRKLYQELGVGPAGPGPETRVPRPRRAGPVVDQPLV